MTEKEAIYILRNAAWLGSDADRQKVEEAVEVVANAIEALNHSEIPNSSDTISRQAAIDIVVFECGKWTGLAKEISKQLKQLPSAQPEPLTDKEQRIFLAAMGREEKVCEEVDRNYVREPYEDSLIRVCKEIRRKVKGALWT